MNKFFYRFLLTTCCCLVFSKKITAQCVFTLSCPSGIDTVCDVSFNNSQYWNELHWWDFAHSLHDMPEAPADLCFTATDTCSGIAPTLRYQLLLDLDGDDLTETLVDSDDLPPVNNIFFNNLNNPPNGTLCNFDERPVATNQKWRFALETSVNGASTTACVRWNTAAAPDVYAVPELPHGLHKIRWIAVASTGDTSICERIFRVRDCVPPMVVCKSGLSVNIMPTGLITLWATDFLHYAEDNVTPPTPYESTQQLQFAVRRAGQGTGFPIDPITGLPMTSVTYACDELGTQLVDLWARDKAGNADSCETFVIVQDPWCNCSNCGGLSVVVCIKNHCDQEGVEGVAIALNGNHPALPPIFGYDQTDSTGCAFLPNYLPLAANYTLTPVKDDNPMNGVSTFDLVLMSKHILGITPLDSPYKIIAADVNKSNSVTTFDIVELRKLILGLYSELPNNTSWRFLDAAFQFDNPVNPFQSAPFAENISVANVQNSQLDDEFVGIKIGDLSCDAVSNVAPAAEARQPVLLVLPDRLLAAGETAELPVRIAEPADWLGFQLALQTDPEALQIEQILPGELPDLDAEAFARPAPGLLTASWFDARPSRVAPDAPLFTLRVRATRPVRLRDALTLNDARLAPEAYDADARRCPLALIFLENAGTAQSDEIEVFAAQPNPTASGAVLPVQLPEAATARIEIVDLTGKILFSNTLNLSEGFHTPELPASALPQAGLYGWRLTAGDKVFSGRIVRQ